jgi:hypothetical protein
MICLLAEMCTAGPRHGRCCAAAEYWLSVTAWDYAVRCLDPGVQGVGSLGMVLWGKPAPIWACLMPTVGLESTYSWCSA